ncbi:MAG: bifunctional riboflavin kinase/FAD synthetase [Candidatus Zixiibacteriota bacterium]
MSLNVIYGIDNFILDGSATVVTIGTFDGLHLGHQAILHKLMDSAKKKGVHALAITFEPHPRMLVTPDSPPPLLTVLNEKIKLMKNYVDGSLLVLNFNEQLMNMNARTFTEKYLVEKIKLAKLIVGYDHAFGKDRSGTINDLMALSKEHNFELEIVNPVLVDGKPISSTRIRNLISDKNFKAAKELFGHPYPLSGKIIRGIGLGKKIGFPTANIDVNSRKLLPKDGVYSCSLEQAGRNLRGMMFIGKNHFNPEEGKSIEVNIFDFDEDIYDQELFCYPEQFVRENMKFDDTSQLVEQLKLDKKNIMRLIK